MTLTLAKERHKTAGRNETCPCGSGKKYKRCHLAEDDQAIGADLASIAAALKAAAELKAAEAEAEEAAGDKTQKAGTSSTSKETQRGRVGNDPAVARAGKGAKSTSLPRRGAV